ASAARAAAATAIAIIAAGAMTEVSIARLGVTSATAPRAERLVVAATASDTPIASATRAGAVRYAPARPRTNHTSHQTSAPSAHHASMAGARSRRWIKRNAAASMIPQAAVSQTATRPLRLGGGGGRLLLLLATGWGRGLAPGRPLGLLLVFPLLAAGRCFCTI